VSVELLRAVLAILSGGLVGFTLGLIGGGGSILATPLLLYVVGLAPHQAIGTGALAVSINAFANFGSYARRGHVRWRSAILFAVVGVFGATIGSSLGKRFDGHRLLFLFAILMIIVGVLMLRRGHRHATRTASLTQNEPKRSMMLVILAALVVGALSGFFGIGGGFLIVPGLLFSTGMPMIHAVGSSLLAVGSFGATTALNYAISGLVNWPVAGEYIAGGVAGGVLGMTLAVRLATHRTALIRIFAALVFAVAAYMLYRNAAAVGIGSLSSVA
jgi:uncharacterized membrane protein YfcA